MNLESRVDKEKTPFFHSWDTEYRKNYGLY